MKATGNERIVTLHWLEKGGRKPITTEPRCLEEARGMVPCVLVVLPSFITTLRAPPHRHHHRHASCRHHWQWSDDPVRSTGTLPAPLSSQGASTKQRTLIHTRAHGGALRCAMNAHSEDIDCCVWCCRCCCLETDFHANIAMRNCIKKRDSLELGF